MFRRTRRCTHPSGDSSPTAGRQAGDRTAGDLRKQVAGFEKSLRDASRTNERLVQDHEKAFSAVNKDVERMARDLEQAQQQLQVAGEEKKAATSDMATLREQGLDPEPA